jgi:hypothetical protein
MTNEITFMIMMSMVALAGLYIIWWTRKQEREEERKQEGR